MSHALESRTGVWNFGTSGDAAYPARVMWRWIIVVAGCILYGVVAGCSILGGRPGASFVDDPPTAAPQARPGRAVETGVLPIRAAGMQIQRTDWIDRYKQSIDEIAALGADAVKIVVDARQEDGNSNVIYVDSRRTPTTDQLADLFRHADSLGLDVIFMPIVLVDDPKGDEWRGTIRPQSWAKWFDSYRDMLGHFLWVCEGNGVDVFVIGSELLSSERQGEEWDETIARVRQDFSGLITYSSNWDHYQNVPFWDELDLIGMNSYWTLGDDEDATVEEIVGNWREIQAELEPFVKAKGKPLIFLEVGWCSLENAAVEPWDYTQAVPIDLDLQARLWEGFWQAWHGTPWLGGFSVWEWTPGDGGPADRGYTPEGKPAEAIIREWMEKPRWEVEVSGG